MSSLFHFRPITLHKKNFFVKKLNRLINQKYSRNLPGEREKEDGEMGIKSLVSGYVPLSPFTSPFPLMEALFQCVALHRLSGLSTAIRMTRKKHTGHEGRARRVKFGIAGVVLIY